MDRVGQIASCHSLLGFGRLLFLWSQLVVLITGKEEGAGAPGPCLGIKSDLCPSPVPGLGLGAGSGAGVMGEREFPLLVMLSDTREEKIVTPFAASL